jgi:Siphovirus Gp157
MATLVTLPVPGPVTAPTAPVEVEATAPPPTQSLTLYDLESNLQALADSAEMVSSDEEQAFLADFTVALTAAKDKRDRVSHFLAHLESQADLAAAEIKRLQARKTAYESLLTKMKGYVVHVIQTLGADTKGKYPKLEGNTASFRIQKNPDSVEITDESAIPSQFKTATVTIPLPLWDELLDAMDMELSGRVLDSIRRPDIAVRNADVKAALKNKEDVPGARWAETSYHLRRE